MFAAILTVTGPAGCLLIIKNYTATPPPRHALLCVPVKARAATLSEPTRTQDAAGAVCSQGDRLNFGLAAERVRAFAPPLPRVYRLASLVCRSPKSSCSARRLRVSQFGSDSTRQLCRRAPSAWMCAPVSLLRMRTRCSRMTALLRSVRGGRRGTSGRTAAEGGRRHVPRSQGAAATETYRKLRELVGTSRKFLAPTDAAFSCAAPEPSAAWMFALNSLRVM